MARLRAGSAEEDERRHDPVLERLEGLIERGRAAGEFDTGLPTRWMLMATLALSHAAGEAFSAGQLTGDEAIGALRASVLRVIGKTSSDHMR